MCIKDTIGKLDDLCLLELKVVTGESVVRSEDQTVMGSVVRAGSRWRPTMLFEFETAPQLMMLRFCLRAKKMDRLRNKPISKAESIVCFGDKVREASLR